MTNKIGLGTVQWGLDYGIANTTGIPADDELLNIERSARKYKIDLLDTAIGYGDAEKRIGSLFSDSFKIISKIGQFEARSVEQQIALSCKNLNCDSLYGCLFHSTDELIQNKYLWDELLAFKSNGTVKKIGFSVYEPNELEILLEMNLIPDLVQLPFNVLDRKFTPYFELLKGKKVEIHARSIFLQGLLFKSEENLSKEFNTLREDIAKIKRIAQEANKNLLEICLGYVLEQPSIDKLILGVETAKQLNEIVVANTSLSKKTIDAINNIEVRQKEMLNPSKCQ